MWKFIIFILVVGGLIAGIIVYNKVLHPKNVKVAGPANTDITVDGFIVKAQTLDNEILASGTLMANEQINIQAEISGKIVEMHLIEGTPVTQGTLLVKLFDDDLQAQLKKQQAQEETAVKTEQRLKQLLAVNGIGQQDYDNATTNLKGIQADIAFTRAQISKTEIRAPFNGIIGLRNVSLGALVSPQTMIATLQQIDPLKIDFTVPEKYSSIVNKGDEINLNVDGFKEVFKGKVYAVEPQLDESTRSMKVRGLVQNSSAKLFPGTYAKVSLGLKRIENALMVPTQCIIPQARNKQVAVVKDGKAVFKSVEMGIRNESYVQVTNDAVQVGDTIVATGIMYLKPNSAVKVKAIMQQAVADSVKK